jgi:hypothetical protein
MGSGSKDWLYDDNAIFRFASSALNGFLTDPEMSTR